MRTVYDTIVLPTDGSDRANAAVAEGLRLASLTGATVHALYVIEPIPLGRFIAGAESAGTEWSGVVDQQREEGEKATKAVVDAAADADPDLSVETAVVHGDPTDKILNYTGDVDADVIVMGTHGRSGPDRILVGSVTETVVRRGQTPVLVIRPETA